MLVDLIFKGSAWTWLVTALIALATVITVQHLLRIRSLPPGPFPLPIVGNLPSFIRFRHSPYVLVGKWRKKYGNLFTIWLGAQPTVMICDWDLCRENLVVKRNEFSGRPARRSFQLFLHGSEDVLFGDLGPAWETLRKILASAIRRFSLSETLPDLAGQAVDEIIEIMLKDGNPVDPNKYIYLALYNILASSTFGRKFEMDDKEFISLRDSNDSFNQTFAEGLPSDFLPFLSFFFRKREKILEETSLVFREYFRNEYRRHQKTYEKGMVRDFMDAVIAARDEAEEESKDSLAYLNDENIVSLNIDLFTAGTDTTRVTLNWLFLFISNYPEVQKKMQEEIDERIGQRYPVQKDRDNCPYVYAVITEVIRLRPVLEIAIEHKSTCDSVIEGYKIPKDTSLMFHIMSSHLNETIWSNAEAFKPERFLDSNGNFTTARKIGYMPFGLGRRSCPGEKLALVDIFLFLVRILQKLELELETGPGTADFEPRLEALVSFNRPYNLIIKKRSLS